MRKPHPLSIVLILLAALFWPTVAATATTLRVGIYQNSPKLFINEQGKPAGIFVEIIEEIARRENWRLEYRPGTWSENLTRLERREIDLLPDVSFSAQREEKFAFNKIFVLESWLDAYARKETRINTIRDLADKKIAVLAGSVQEQYLREEIRPAFGIDFTLQVHPDYPASVQAVKSGEADLLVASRFFHLSPDRNGMLQPKHVIFRPENLYFAFPKETSPDLIAAIDRQLAALKNDPESAYYQIIRRWLAVPAQVVVPGYLKWLLALSGALLLALAIFSLLLRRQVAAATDQLQQAATEKQKLQLQLQQAEKMEALGRLAGGVAHDYNNMLTIISSNAEMALKRAEAGSRLAEELAEILVAARRSAEITRQLLTFARAQATAAPQLLDLNQSVAGMLAILKRLLGPAITLRWRPGSDLPPIFLDPAHLHQILANLATNARDAIGERPGEVAIATAHVRLAGGEYLLLTFRDNGEGIAPETINKIFDPFFTTKEIGKGTGLGLATIYGIVQQRQGFIEVESAPGQGACFKILLKALIDGNLDNS